MSKVEILPEQPEKHGYWSVDMDPLQIVGIYIEPYDATLFLQLADGKCFYVSDKEDFIKSLLERLAKA